MTLVLSPLRGQPGEVIEVQNAGQSPQLCQSVDSTALPVSVTTDQVQNVSSVPGATDTDALQSLSAGVTAVAASVTPSQGFVSRFVYVNAASTRIGTSFVGVTCTAAPTWTTLADLPPGNWNWIDFWLCANGGGGASGATIQSTTCGTTAAGGGAAISPWGSFSRADIIAAPASPSPRARTATPVATGGCARSATCSR